jgi:hypothetical protein
MPSANFMPPCADRVFFRIMPAPRDRGRKLRDEIEGLQRYLEIAEEVDIARLEVTWCNHCAFRRAPMALRAPSAVAG